MNTLRPKIRRRWVWATSVLVVVALMSVLTGAVYQQSNQPKGLPAVELDTPPVVMTKSELNAASEKAVSTPMALVVKGRTLEVPDEARVDGLMLKGHGRSVVINGSTMEPLPRPVYVVIRSNEIASVSKVTGEFQIGQDHRDTFQFLIDQLGKEKMQLIDTGYYEKRWTPHRERLEQEKDGS